MGFPPDFACRVVSEYGTMWDGGRRDEESLFVWWATGGPGRFSSGPAVEADEVPEGLLGAIKFSDQDRGRATRPVNKSGS